MDNYFIYDYCLSNNSDFDKFFNMFRELIFSFKDYKLIFIKNNKNDNNKYYLHGLSVLEKITINNIELSTGRTYNLYQIKSLINDVITIKVSRFNDYFESLEYLLEPLVADGSLIKVKSNDYDINKIVQYLRSNNLLTVNICDNGDHEYRGKNDGIDIVSISGINLKDYISKNEILTYYSFKDLLKKNKTFFDHVDNLIKT